MGDLKGAPAVHFNLTLQSFSLYINFKKMGLPLPVSLFLWNRGGLVNEAKGGYDRTRRLPSQLMPFMSSVSDPEWELTRRPNQNSGGTELISTVPRLTRR